jgi:hypothetical protein
VLKKCSALLRRASSQWVNEVIPLSEEILLLNALDMVVLEHLADGALLLKGRPPGWFERICPITRSRGYRAELTTAAPFLEQFLLQAGELWSSGHGRVHSGYWVQRDIDGNERHIEAWAVQTEARQFLVLRLLGAEFDETRHALQEFRALKLAREIQSEKVNSKAMASHLPYSSVLRYVLLAGLLVAIPTLAVQGSGRFHPPHGAMIVLGVVTLACVIALFFSPKGV